MRSVADIIGGRFGDPGASLAVAMGAGEPMIGQPNAMPLGALTGAPPQTQLRTYQVIPAAAVGATNVPTLVAEPDRASRVLIFTAPLIGFSIYIGDSGVTGDPGSSGLALPAGLPYEVIVPGLQAVYAVTDAPVYVPLRVQIAAILIGDRERRP